MKKGIVKEYDPDRGFGFIQGEDGEDYFLHVSGLRPHLQSKGLREGQRVLFDVDFDMKSMVSVDVQTIFHKMEKRTLEAAYKFYCDKNLDDAHSAEADTLATYEVLLAQLDRYPELENDIKKLSEFTTRRQNLDFAGFIGLNENQEPIFAFGKHNGKTVEEVMEKEPGYFGWILNADFPLYTKKVLTQIKLSKLNNKF